MLWKLAQSTWGCWDTCLCIVYLFRYFLWAEGPSNQSDSSYNSEYSESINEYLWCKQFLFYFGNPFDLFLQLLRVFSKQFFLVFAPIANSIGLQLNTHLLSLFTSQCLKAFVSVYPFNTLWAFLLKFSHNESFHKLFPFPPNALNKLLLNPKYPRHNLSAVFYLLIDQLSDFLHQHGEALSMDLSSTSLAFSIAASESDLAWWVGTQFGDLFARGAEDVRVFLSEFVEHGFELLIGIVVLFLLH